MVTNEELFKDGKKLPLIEEFYTIQGEGFHMGKAAYFIRVGGCDIGCSWCDSKISWSAKIHQLTDIEKVVEKARNCNAKSVVVTGGEPSQYNLQPLCEELKKYNIETFIETAGIKPLTGIWDWICLSPKQHKPPHESMYARADELKVIVTSEESIKWAEECKEKVGENCLLYLQSEWSVAKEMYPIIVEYIKKNPEWNISIQAHKYMKIP